MEFARKVWKVLVAVKDGLALLLLLLFFMALYALMSAGPGPALVRDGALLIALDGTLVEEPSDPDPLQFLLSGQAPVGEYRARDVARAIRLAARDERINSVVLDLSGFLGGGMVHLQEIGDALDEVRAAKKPVLAYGVAYVDDGMLLAAHASEVWLDPSGGAFIVGPGGNSLYFARALERFKIDVEVYRVGTFKSAVEPYILNAPSPEAMRAYEAIYADVWEAWKADYAKARPRAKLALVTGDPVGWLKAARGSAAEAARAAGLVDRLGTPSEFAARVREIAGEGPGSGETLKDFAHTGLDTWLGANPEHSPGKPIGVVTIAGTIVDGDAGPGTAGGDRIVRILDEALDDELAALVVRVDSPGGTVVASERIRRAIERHKARKIPVVVSMANVAASGGYWVATPGSTVLAEPATITGSIGVFALLPKFDRALADLGVTGGGVKTTALSGQPDVLTGLSPEFSEMMQANIANTYDRFVTLVGKTRKVSAANAAQWAEGRPWSGAAARQLGLVDSFGGLDDALALAAKQAKLGEGEWHARFLGQSHSPLSGLLRSMGPAESAPSGRGLDLAGLAAERQRAGLEGAVREFEMLLNSRNIQAYCTECSLFSHRTGRGDKSESSLLAAVRRLGVMRR